MFVNLFYQKANIKSSTVRSFMNKIFNFIDKLKNKLKLFFKCSFMSFYFIILKY